MRASQRGRAATKEEVNDLVYNFSASCVEVRGKESKGKISMNVFLATLAFVGLALAATVHVASNAGIDVSYRFPLVWLLHVGIFVVFIPFVGSCRKVLSTRPSFFELLALVPVWVLFVGVAILVYVMINFRVFIASTLGGSPAIEKGRYVLMNHGRLIREITRAEYTALRANELKGVSGIWLVFYFIPFAYFLFGKKD